MSEPIIEIRDVGKRYRLGGPGTGDDFHLRSVLRSLLTRPIENLRALMSDPPEESLFWALRDVCCEIGRGEAVGLIGRNGAGKTTLLKLLSRITPPTTGEIVLRGRVASLLEVGTGFHPEFTGRENIYVNGAILGMSRAEIDESFDEIVSFAGVERFIDTPVKRYSSGMFVRLAFAVAAHLRPEILLVDEVLAVGDIAFQSKCLGKMQSVSRDQGRTVIFVSHNMAAVRELCSRVLYIKDGTVFMDGTPADCIAAYTSESIRHRREGRLDPFRLYRIDESRPAFFREIRVVSRHGLDGKDGLPVFACGDDIDIELDIEVTRPVPDVKVTIDLARATGERVAVVFSGDKDSGSFHLEPPGCTINCRIEGLPLTQGTYQAGIGINVAPGQAASFDYLTSYPLFVIDGVPQAQGRFPERKWGILHWEGVNWTMRKQSP